MNQMRRILSLTAVAAVLPIAACSNGGTPEATPGGVTTITAVPSADASETASGEPTKTEGTDDSSSDDSSSEPTKTDGDDQPSSDGSSDDAPPRCTHDQLTGTTSHQGTAGTVMVNVSLENTSDRTCVLKGYAGVSMVGHDNGTQIGAAADRDKGTGDTITLKPHQKALLQIRLSQAGHYDDDECQPTKADGFRIYPPEDTKAIFVADKGLTGCASKKVHLLKAAPIKAG